MKRVKSIFKLLLIAAFFVTIADLVAGDKVVPKDVPEPSAAAAWLRRLSDFQSDGLPLDEVVKRLRADFPDRKSVV